MSSTSFSNTALLQIEKQITNIQSRLNTLSLSSDLKTGNHIDDTLVTLDIDREREYWTDRLMDLKRDLKKHDKGQREGVGIIPGDKVRLLKQGSREALEVRIAERLEFYPGEKCVSISSPIGRTVLGKTPGQLLEANTPNGRCKFQIVEVQRG